MASAPLADAGNIEHRTAGAAGRHGITSRKGAALFKQGVHSRVRAVPARVAADADRTEARDARRNLRSRARRVGGRAAGFALERLGFPLWTIHTVTLPWHPGHGRASRIIPDEAAFEALIDDLIRAPWLGEIGGILTGYLGAASQAPELARLIDAIRACGRT